MNENYAIINESNGKCINVALWDGVSQWNPGEGLVAVRSDEIKIDDDCQLVDGVWSKI